MAKQSTFLNMVLCLFVVCLVSSAVLGIVYAVTKEPITKAQIAKINNAIAGVVPKFDNVPSSEAFDVTVNNNISKVYPAKMNGVIVGYAIESTTSKGFSGTILLMVGFDMDGNIYNTSVISHAETPGLGEKMVAGKSDFPNQFVGKNPESFRLAVKKDGGDIDAITAATITSRAYADAILNAYEVFKTIKNNTLK